ncbi:hypothetical protein DCAR_0623054 [Daucus carota subsp. sativus]|uniref:Uncharacterized protein n=1 Tax=Daucus carota subsp. sativus TaxID=79200 RepID=A0A164V155_DAUCS|nr:PREDICTED: protein NLP5-like [Daucus carota subsp. sativus]XP_017258330.1 PREDICTED: protein NLP5-like [Daucus carota subsp. sativus]WOH03655.1 hypothetical protein DCAR_0623054 [Daucus carota subsp. sativus]
MGDASFPPNNNMLYTSPDPVMDLDLDELLFDGCWLEANDGSEFFNQSPPPFDPSFLWSSMENYNGDFNWTSVPKDSQEERQRSSYPGNLSISQPPNQIQGLGNDMLTSTSHIGNYSVEGSQLGSNLWIGPRPIHGRAMSVMDRVVRALEYFKSSTRDTDVLLQLWVPIDRGGRRVLSTCGQPFSLDSNSPRLANYRAISVKYQFSAEHDSKEVEGMPSRVFMGKVPEWTPDVRFYKREEYQRVRHAQQYDVRGTLAVPVFEQGTCLGVIEIVTTSQKINYKPELESVCEALKAVDLRGSEVASTHSMKICNGSYQSALPEIMEVLRCTCETNRLPLAQTWIPCVQQGKEGCRHSDENIINCVSTLDSACYIAEPSIRGFHEACSEHHLLRGQGVVGKAFMSNQPSFSPDVTSDSKTEYPLSHHARMFGLCAAVAIRLRSIYTGTSDFVLEFFLPVNCRDPEDQKILLNALSIVIQKVCHSLRIVTDTELHEETLMRAGKAVVPSADRLGKQEIAEVENSAKSSHEVSFRTSSNMEMQESKPRELTESASSPSQYQQISADGHVTFNQDLCASGRGSYSSVGKTGEKRRGKTDKNITLDMLRQYFAGSLKDAAKSLGVCPTTLKRICRQHGITRWPSRKIKKVGHSLQKIQGVIDSVQGASGGFQIKSFYSNFPELASPNSSKHILLTASKPIGNSSQNEGSALSPEAVASKSPPSSCSQSSNSSHCYSSGTQAQPCNLNGLNNEDQVGCNPGEGILKRATSAVHLHASTHDVPKVLSRSQSYKNLIRQPRTESPSRLPNDIGENIPEGDSTSRVKVTYGEEKIRFRMLNSMTYDDLLVEITKRFCIDDRTGFHLKYLDDDSEWVLLTCDDDLEECREVCESAHSQTIKLSLHQNPTQHLGSSYGSSQL